MLGRPTRLDLSLIIPFCFWRREKERFQSIKTDVRQGRAHAFYAWTIMKLERLSKIVRKPS